MARCCTDDKPLPKPIDQSHRYGRHQAACREPAGSYDKTTWTAICFGHKTQYLLIRAPYTRIVVFWHISNIPPMILQNEISCKTPTFLPEASFGLRVLSLPASVCPCVRVCVSITGLSTRYSTTICKLVDLIPALHQSDCRIPNWVSVKTVHSSSTNCTARNLHTSGIDAGHVQYKNVSLQNKLQPVKFYIGYFLRFDSIIF